MNALIARYLDLPLRNCCTCSL